MYNVKWSLQQLLNKGYKINLPVSVDEALGFLSVCPLGSICSAILQLQFVQVCFSCITNML